MGGLCRPDHPGRIPTKNSLDYLIHDSGGWGHVSKVYSPGIGPKGLALVRFHVIKSASPCDPEMFTCGWRMAYVLTVYVHKLKRHWLICFCSLDKLASLTQILLLWLAEAANSFGWTQHAQYFWREWCYLRKSCIFIIDLFQQAWINDQSFLTNFTFFPGWSPRYPAWWLTPPSKKSKVWQGLSSS